MNKYIIQLDEKKSYSKSRNHNKLPSPQNSVLKKTLSNFSFHKLKSLNNKIKLKENNKEKIQLKKIKKLPLSRNKFINTIQLDQAYLKLISIKNIKKIDDFQNNSQFINSVYIPHKNQRTDFDKHKFLLGKKNYYKKIINSENGLSGDRNLIPFKINININNNIFNEENKTKRINYLLFQSDYPKLISQLKKNYSFPSIKNNNNKNISSDNNAKDDKNKKQKEFHNLTKYFYYKYTILSQNKTTYNNINKKKNRNSNESSKYKSIIEDNYKEYLNEISSSEVNSTNSISKNKDKAQTLEKRANNNIFSKGKKIIKKKMINFDNNNIPHFKGFKIKEKKPFYIIKNNKFISTSS